MNTYGEVLNNAEQTTAIKTVVLYLKKSLPYTIKIHNWYSQTRKLLQFVTLGGNHFPKVIIMTSLF